MNINKYFVISGRVQGVFYRRYTQKTARALGLTGWVRNTHDGCVEVLACGEETQINALEKWLWEGPPAAQVEKVSVQAQVVPTEILGDFEIR